MNGKNDADILVVGGGFAGLVTAVSLAKHGFHVVVLEALSGPIESLRGELIHPRGVRSLEALGLSDALRERGAVEVIGFAAYAAPDAPPVMLDYAHGHGLGLEHRTIVAALRDQLQRNDAVRFETRARVESLVFATGRLTGVTCADGRTFTAKIVVAADGRYSKLRKLLAIPHEVTKSSYTIAATLPGDVLPVARHGHVFVGAPGPVLAYPFGERQVRMCIDVPLDAPRGQGPLTQYIEENYASSLPLPMAREMVESLRRDPFRACINHAIATHACVVPGGALVGDAAGCSHPLTATGMTIAGHDAATLARCLLRHGLTDRGLAAYQRNRYGFARARELFTASLYQVLRGHGQGPDPLREAVFDYWKDPRARRASLDILSGDESGAGAFFREYWRVVGAAANGLATFAWRTKDARGLGRRTSSIVATASACLGLAAGKARSELKTRATFRPTAFPASGLARPEAATETE